jgi:hypothetical protein
MSEARKYHLNLIVANQFTTQLSEEIRDAVFGNMGTIISFRIGQNDVDSLTRYFQPLFDSDDLLRVPNWNAIVRTLVGGVPTQPFSMAGLPPLGNPNSKLGEALKQLSWAKYGRPKEKVEAEIFGRLATKEEPSKPAFGQSPPRAGSMPTKPAAASKIPGKGSFLDEWLAKRKQPSSSITPKPTGSPVSNPAFTAPQASSQKMTPPPSPASIMQAQSSTDNLDTPLVGQTTPSIPVQATSHISSQNVPAQNSYNPLIDSNNDQGMTQSQPKIPVAPPRPNLVDDSSSSFRTTVDDESRDMADQIRISTNEQQGSHIQAEPNKHKSESTLDLNSDEPAEDVLHIKRD